MLLAEFCTSVAMADFHVFAPKFNKHFDISCKGLQVFARHSMTFVVALLVCRFHCAAAATHFLLELCIGFFTPS